MQQTANRSTGSAGTDAVQGVQEKAQEQVQQVAEQAREVAGQAQSRVRDEIDGRTTEIGRQIQSTGEDFRTVGKQLREQGKDTPARFADQAAQRVEQVGRYLSESNTDKILSDVERFARKQPWTVIVGGLTLGFVASRFLKASGSRRYETMYNWRLPAGQASAVTGQIPSHTSTSPVDGSSSGRP